MRALQVLLSAAVALTCCASTSAAPLKRITTASSVRVRAAASTSASVVDTLGVGVVLDELERSDAQQTINGVREYWYRVATPSGKQGWVFGGLSRSVDPNRLDEAALTIGRERLELTLDDLTFADWADLTDYLRRAAASATSRDARAELELMDLTAASNALFATPVDKTDAPPYKTFRASLGNVVVYNEIGANWLVTAAAYWALRDRYSDLPIGERIAWDASNVALPGECEGDLSCNLEAWVITRGRYLKLYPAGQYASVAVGELAELVRPAVIRDPNAVEDTYTLPAEAEYRAILRKDVADAKAALQGITANGRDDAVKLLDALDGRLTEKP